jgi:hypothetical protein
MTIPSLVNVDPAAQPRTRSALALIAAILNSLLLKGDITQDNATTWSINMAGGAIIAGGIYGSKGSYGMWGG